MKLAVGTASASTIEDIATAISRNKPQIAINTIDPVETTASAIVAAARAELRLLAEHPLIVDPRAGARFSGSLVEFL